MWSVAGKFKEGPLRGCREDCDKKHEKRRGSDKGKHWPSCMFDLIPPASGVREGMALHSKIMLRESSLAAASKAGERRP